MIDAHDGRVGDPIARDFPREPLPEAFVARAMARVRAAGPARPAAPPLRGFGVDALVALAAAVAVTSALWGAARVLPASWVPAGAPSPAAAWIAAGAVFAAGAGAMALAAWLAAPAGGAARAAGRR